jgi:isoquinoline 1-oxidoreductase beta subunit
MTHLSRRSVLKTAGASLVIGFTLTRGREVSAAAPLAPNAFVRIDGDSTVTVISKHVELGQGVFTGLPQILADELDADWSKIRVEGAPANVKLYSNSVMQMQGTGGSSAIFNSWTQLREAGATARAMLVAAAARQWNVPAAEITVRHGVIAHTPSGRTSSFGPFVAAAAKMKPPADVKVKDPKDFTLIGQPLKRTDAFIKSTGAAQYTMDVKMPGLLTAVIARPPRFGGVVKAVDSRAARAVPGVQHVLTIPAGVAVIADSFWSAARGRDGLVIDWNDDAAEHRGSDELTVEYRALADKPGKIVRQDGDAASVLKTAAKVVTADYEVPYLAHAPMEPLDCVIKRTETSCEMWFGCQFTTVDQNNAAAVLGLKPDQVSINMLMGGGSFGRRSTPKSDVVVEAASIAKALPVGTPVKLVWTREDDIRGGYYRPMYYHRLQAGLDAKGNIIAWSHRIIGQSILADSPFAGMIKDGMDPMIFEGASIPYKVPNVHIDMHTTKVGVPVLWWRAVGSTHTAFVTEAFFDRVAKAADRDPLELRRALLPPNSRHLAAINLAAEKAGAVPGGRGRGVAVAESFGSVVAHIADVSRTADGRLKVDNVVCAVDCGIAVNPNLIAAQMEGGIAFGLSAALKGAITLKNGMVEQSNFDTYDVLRLADMPNVDVHIVPSRNNPTGTGEPGVPPIAPAVANAILALTGTAITKLPITRQLSV